eukprot:403342628
MTDKKKRILPASLDSQQPVNKLLKKISLNDSKEHSLKNETALRQQILIDKNLFFKDVKAAFVMIGKEMTKKRVEIFTYLIKELNLPFNHENIQSEINQRIYEILRPIKIVTPEWLTRCLMEKKLISNIEPYEIKIEIPNKEEVQLRKINSGVSDQKNYEEEKLDRVVNLEEIIDDIYRMKFQKDGKNSQKRVFDELSKSSSNILHKNETKSHLNGNQSQENEDENFGINLHEESSHRSLRSKFYKDGEECFSEDSYLHSWKPEYIANRENYWDKKKHMFACSRGSTLKENQIIEDGQIKELSDVKQENLSQDANLASQEMIDTQTTKKKPMNDEIIKQLEKLYKYYEAQDDKGRMHGYRRGLTFLRSYKDPIYSVEQLESVPYLGNGILKKVQELIEEGSIKRFEFLSHDESVVVTELLEGVWGVGPKLAQKLYKQGIRSIEDLRQNQHLLTEMQKIGLKYYEDIKQRIPRHEVTQMLELIRQTAFGLIPNGEKLLKVDACGSYRRGKQSCGDIDILITKVDGSSIHGFVKLLVLELEKQGFLKERLGGLRFSHIGSEGYMGMCQLRPDLPFRRIDIKAYPLSQYGFAQLYFTGSGNFNRSMRLFAQKKGYSLSDYGLTPVIRVKGEKVAEFESVPCETEEDVFKALNLDYKPPYERDI